MKSAPSTNNLSWKKKKPGRYLIISISQAFIPPWHSNNSYEFSLGPAQLLLRNPRKPFILDLQAL
ncbi:hypothetical protein KIS4809_3426 [Bacillus sp. ZZV12-4809]|nr:hypothetical protein KIS4809_3426 [Bacillus sp. ZZV12-4809]